MLQLVGQREGRGFQYVAGVPSKIDNFHNLFTKLPQIIDKIPADQRWNLFYTAAHHKGVSNSSNAIRLHSTFEYQEIIAFDIDKADVEKPYEYARALSDVLDVPDKVFTIIVSGNGLHFVVSLDNPITTLTYFENNKKYYDIICENINLRLKQLELPGHADNVIFEAARVLRLPYTQNRKDNSIKAASLVRYSQDTMDLDLRSISGMDFYEERNIPKQEVKTNWPKPDFKEIYKECQFIQWVSSNPEEVHEPHAFDALSILSNQPDDANVQHQGVERSPKALAQWIVDNASESKSLKGTLFEDKWKQAAKYGVRTCDGIDKTWHKCDTCPHYGLIKTPLSLKSRGHIGSESTGYWVRNKKGDYLYPNYSELAHLFKEKYKLKSFSDGRIYAYQDGVYLRLEIPYIKSLLESVVKPSHPLREGHRNEFIAKLFAETCLSKAQERHFFERSITDKICFQNGVYDFTKRELVAHSPDYGFKTKIDYDFIPDQKSFRFDDWLTTITKGSLNLRVIILDMMAYCLWPKYDNHAFFFLSGDGKNGKSTLLAVLRQVLGEGNTSAVPLTDLVNNRFSRARLDGKCANISDEGSGVTMGSQQLNLIKTLSSGEPISVEEKGKTSYDMVNTAKLIFNVNRAPDFKENSEAMRRRLVTIPFPYTIEKEDASIGEELLKETPKVCSMLIDHIAENQIAHDGKFRLRKETDEIKSANSKMLSAHNPVAQWAEETVEEAGPDSWLDIDDIYRLYAQWCTTCGIRDMDTRITFTKNMRDFVVKSQDQYARKRIGNRMRRVFLGIKLKGVYNGQETETAKAD